MTRTPAIGLGVVWLLAASWPGCGNRGDVLPPPEPAHESVNTGDGADEVRELQLRDWSAFGMPVPEGAVLDESGTTHAHFRISGAFENVVSFFTGQLPDFQLTRYDEGVKLEAQDLSDRSLYVYEADGDILITYMDESPDPSERPSGVASSRRTAIGTVADDGSMVLSTNRRVPAGVGGNGGSRPAIPAFADARNDNVSGDETSPVDGGRRDPGTGDPMAPSGGTGAGSPSGASPGAGGATSADLGPGGERGAGTPGGGPIRRVQPVRPRNERGTTNPHGTRPIDFVHGVFEPPGNPNAYY